MAEVTPTTSLIPGRERETESTISPTTIAIQQQSVVLGTVAQQISNISNQMFSLNVSMQAVQQNLAQNTFLDRQREFQEQEQQRMLAQERLREGKEGVIENKIQNALLKPVSSVAKRVQGILGRLTNFFMFVLGGWLVGGILKWMEAKANDNKSLAETLKTNLIRNVVAVLGTLFVVRWGIGTLVSTLFRVAGRVGGLVWKNIIWAPFALALNWLRKSIAKFFGMAAAGATGGAAVRGAGVGASAATLSPKTAGKPNLLTRAGGPISGAFETVGSMQQGKPYDEALVRGAGAWGGFGIGAKLGTMVSPGWGTAIGGIAGGLLGPEVTGGLYNRFLGVDQNKEQTQFPTGVNVDEFFEREGIQPMNIEHSNAFREANPELFATGEDLDLVNQERAMFGQPPLPSPVSASLDRDSSDMEISPVQQPKKEEGRSWWNKALGAVDAATGGFTDFDSMGSKGQLFEGLHAEKKELAPPPKQAPLVLPVPELTSSPASVPGGVRKETETATPLPVISSRDFTNPYTLAQQANFNVVGAA